MKLKFSPIGVCAIIGALFLTPTTGCKKDDDKKNIVIPNQEEVITTLRYALTPKDGGETLVLLFRDVDGDGGLAPVITTDTLVANTVYSGVLELLNESILPAENISDEIEDEAEEHQFFYHSSSTTLTFSYDDEDENGKPIGLRTEVNTSDPETAQLSIVLRHQPDKSGIGVADGDITNAGGETDIELTFQLVVK